MLDYRQDTPRVGPRNCPVKGCLNKKTPEDLVCPGHWHQVPRVIRHRIWELYREAKGSDAHRTLCLDTIAALSAAWEQTAGGGPVKRWSDMTAAEQARVRAQTRPPRPRPSPEAESPAAVARRKQARAGASVDVTAQKLMRETERAALFVVHGEQVWFPKSVIDEREQQPDGSWVLIVKGWFAQKEGLLDG
jgi:hypothetical protein